MSRTYTFLGATGNVGKPAALALLQAGHHVRAIVRNSTSPAATELKNAGAELIDSGFVAGDPKLGALYCDEKVLVSAFSNVDGIFSLVIPNLQSPNPADEAEAFVALFKRAVEKAENVKRIVFLSSFGAQHKTGTGVVEKCYRMEKTLESLASKKLSLVFLRPGYFFSNLAQSLASVSQGYLAYAINKDTKVDMISTEDIGHEAASLLKETNYKGGVSIVEITGPEALTMTQVADKISAIIGKQVAYVALSSEDLLKAFLSFGMSQKGAESLLGIVAGIEDGTVDFEHKDTLIHTKTTMDDFLRSALKQ